MNSSRVEAPSGFFDIFRRVVWLVALAAFSGMRPVHAQDTNGLQGQIAAAKAEENKAMDEVRRIVNQPVRSFPLTPDMSVTTFQGSWFHWNHGPPNYKGVDVVTCQQLPYAKSTYVNCDVNPGVVYYGRDLEVNGALEYFYNDNTSPKRRLSLAEMNEINRLYRIIGSCEDALLALQPPPPAPPETDTNDVDETAATRLLRRIPRLDKADGVLAVLGVVLLYGGYRIFRRS
jgi:hypothetical protein